MLMSLLTAIAVTALSGLMTYRMFVIKKVYTPAEYALLAAFAIGALVWWLVFAREVRRERSGEADISGS